jgi:hypothetical protein
LQHTKSHLCSFDILSLAAGSVFQHSRQGRVE